MREPSQRNAIWQVGELLGPPSQFECGWSVQWRRRYRFTPLNNKFTTTISTMFRLIDVASGKKHENPGC